MSDQPSSNNRPNPGAGSPGRSNNNRRRHHNRRRPPTNNNKGNPPNRPTDQNQKPQNVQQGRQPDQQNRPDSRVQLAERIYEKYHNLLEQHLIARRKYHDLFYRADPAQKNKLEKHFFATIKEIRDFEGRLNPLERELFEKRHNGLRPDLTYSTVNEIDIEAATQVIDDSPSDPHYLQSQRKASYKDDREESVGSKDDYEKYKMSH